MAKFLNGKKRPSLKRLIPKPSVTVGPPASAMLAIGWAPPAGPRPPLLLKVACNHHIETLAMLSLEQAESVVVGAVLTGRPRRRRRGGLRGVRQRRQHWANDMRAMAGPQLVSYLPAATITTTIDYPLSVQAKVTVPPYYPRGKPQKGRRKPRVRRGGTYFTGQSESTSLGYLLWTWAQVYRQLYRAPARHGVWGHRLGDLWFEGVMFYADGTAELVVGS